MSSFMRLLGASRYVPTTIVSSAHEYDLFACERSAEVDGFSIRIMVHAKTTRAARAGAAELTSVLATAVQVLGALTSLRRSPRHITVHALCHPAKRCSDPTQPLGPEHINGGVQMQGPSGQPLIFVFRTEEMAKVAIHELVHALNVFPSTYPARLDAEVRPGSSGLALGEALVDALACYVDARLRSRDHRRFVENLAKLRRHVVAKAATVSAHLKRFPEERTHAFSYYVAKAALLVHGVPQLLALLASGSRSPKRDASCLRLVVDCTRAFLASARWHSKKPLVRTALRMTPIYARS